MSHGRRPSCGFSPVGFGRSCTSRTAPFSKSSTGRLCYVKEKQIHIHLVKIIYPLSLAGFPGTSEKDSIYLKFGCILTWGKIAFSCKGKPTPVNSSSHIHQLFALHAVYLFTMYSYGCTHPNRCRLRITNHTNTQGLSGHNPATKASSVHITWMDTFRTALIYSLVVTWVLATGKAPFFTLHQKRLS